MLYGDSESFISAWLAQNPHARKNIFLATKFYYRVDAATGAHIIDTTAENCKRCCAESLEKLGIETIDLFYIHRLNPATPIEETIHAMVELKNEGKIRYFGDKRV